MITKNPNPNKRMFVARSWPLWGTLPIRTSDPIERANPKTRSESVSILIFIRGFGAVESFVAKPKD